MSCLFVILIVLIVLIVFILYNKYIEYYSQILNKRKFPDYTRWILSDKYVAKQYAEMNGFHIPTTYQVVKYPKDIDFSKIPKNYVVKPIDLCSSYGVYLVKNNINLITNKKVSNKKIVKNLNLLRAKVNNSYYMHDLMYNNLVPYTGYIVEELLLDNGEIPHDYKCYTFNGRIYLIALTFNRRIVKGKQLFDSIWVTRDWNPIYFSMIKKNYKYTNIKKPPEYDLLIEKVENISSKLNRHCRIDVYCLNKKIYFGEFTFFCGATLHTFLCNLILGIIWILNPDDYNSYDKSIDKLVPSYYNNPYN